MDKKKFDSTMKFNVLGEKEARIADIMGNVYSSLDEKGYNPINQLVGYLLSGDPAYITSYNNARSVIRHVERDEILEELLLAYLDKHKIK